MFKCHGDTLAFGTAEFVIAAYSWSGPDTIKRDLDETRKAIAEQAERYEREMEAIADNPDKAEGPSSPAIIWKAGLTDLNGKALVHHG
jgi:hypothetical protein